MPSLSRNRAAALTILMGIVVYVILALATRSTDLPIAQNALDVLIPTSLVASGLLFGLLAPWRSLAIILVAGGIVGNTAFEYRDGTSCDGEPSCEDNYGFWGNLMIMAVLVLGPTTIGAVGGWRMARRWPDTFWTVRPGVPNVA